MMTVVIVTMVIVVMIVVVAVVLVAHTVSFPSRAPMSPVRSRLHSV